MNQAPITITDLHTGHDDPENNGVFLKNYRGGEKTRAAAALSRVRLDVAASTVAAALKSGERSVPVSVQHGFKVEQDTVDCNRNHASQCDDEGWAILGGVGDCCANGPSDMTCKPGYAVHPRHDCVTGYGFACIPAACIH